MRVTSLLLPLLLGIPFYAAAQNDCRRSSIVEPQPFLGTAEEIITLADGSIWKDVSYKYLYLYAYYPQIIICPSTGKMILAQGSQQHVFQLQRLQ